jgi:tetratricopeptide (TPR) repeat protein
VTTKPPDREAPQEPPEDDPRHRGGAGKAARRRGTGPPVAADDELWARILRARGLAGEGGDLSRAEDELEVAAGLLTGDIDDAVRTAYYAERVRVAAGLGDIVKALGYAAESIRAASRSSVVHADAAMLFRELGDLVGAIEALYTVLGSAGDFRYFAALVSLLREAGRSGEALRICDRMVESHPTLAEAYALRGLTRFMNATDVSPLAADAVPRLRDQMTDDLHSALRFGSEDLEQTRALRACLSCL